MANTHAAEAASFFQLITRWRWVVLALSACAIVATGLSLPKIERDTSPDAFISADEPALVYKDRIEDEFGIKAPIVIAIIDHSEAGIYSRDSLSLVLRLTRAVEKLPQIDPDRVISLATEDNISGTEDGMVTEGFLDASTELFSAPLGSAERGEEIRKAIAEFPLYHGSLVSKDNSTTLIVAELIDEDSGLAAYEALLDIIQLENLPDTINVHISGEGAVSGYLSTYIDRDAARLNPLAGVIITLVLLVAFMSLRAAILPNLVVLATVVCSFGLMGATGTSFYVITNGLVVNLIGIAVADSIHIVSRYYVLLRERPSDSKHAVIVQTMRDMWRPVTLTTLTTIVGFLALAASSTMPPVRAFGLFGALGVGLAWVYSLTLLPAMLAIWPSKRLPLPFRSPEVGEALKPNISERMMTQFGRIVLSIPKTIVILAVIGTLVAAYGASQIIVDDASIDNFKPSEPIYQADVAINGAMDGTYTLDILIEADAPMGIYEPAVLRRIEELQSHLLTYDHINGSTSIADYVKQLHKSVNEGREAFYTIPDNANLVAQLIFLYGASSDPADFEDKIDYDATSTLVRARVNSGRYSASSEIIPALKDYISTQFDTNSVKARVTGRVAVTHAWIDKIDRSNLIAVLLSFIAVTLTAMLVFRSVLTGLIAAAPVALAVLVVYAVMGFAGIPLGIGTSMFSAIAIGLSIDFAIHTIDRIREIGHEKGLGAAALLDLYPSTGRALLFNFIAVAGGFGVLATSDVPPLIKFGALVAVAVSVAFLASLTFVPALVLLIKPKSLHTHPLKEAFNDPIGI